MSYHAGLKHMYVCVLYTKNVSCYIYTHTYTQIYFKISFCLIVLPITLVGTIEKENFRQVLK